MRLYLLVLAAAVLAVGVVTRFAEAARPSPPIGSPESAGCSGNYMGFCPTAVCTDTTCSNVCCNAYTHVAWCYSPGNTNPTCGLVCPTGYDVGPGPTLGYPSCLCAMGYGNNGDSTQPCVACAANSYKNTVGFSPCTVGCPSNSVSTGATGGTASVACQCNSGYYGLQSTSSASCASCPSGTYKSGAGNGDVSACSSCPSNSAATTATGATSASVACTCNAGYQGLYGGSTTCSACSTGYYKSAAGNQACVAIPANSVNNGSTAFTCNAGYAQSGGSCAACAPGTYKTTSGNNVCTAIPANSVNNGTTSFSCNAGYTQSGSSCVACASGTYKAASGNDVCTAIPIDSSNNGTTGFACDAGYTQSGSTCAACVSGTYKEVAGNDACVAVPSNSVNNGTTGFACSAGYTLSGSVCVACATGYYKAATGNDGCTAIPTNSVNNGTAEFSCDAGYTLSGGSCVACAAGYFKSSAGNDACASNPPNSASNGTTGFACNEGYTQSGSTCVSCATGYFKATVGNDPCVGIPANATGNGTTGFICNSGLYWSAQSLECTTLPPNSISDGQNNYACLPGYSGNASTTAGECDACPVNFFKPDLGNAACTACPTNTTTLTFSGSTSLQNCTAIPPGYIVNATTGLAEACPQDTFADSFNTTCLACPANSSTLGAVAQVNCTAGPGFYLDPTSLAVVPCPADTIKVSSGNSVDACVACSSGMGTQGRAGVSDWSCACAAGSMLSGSSCVKCAADTFKGYGNGTVCWTCPWGTTTKGATGAISSSSCVLISSLAYDGAAGVVVCASGYEPSGSLGCQPCQVDSYKSTAGNGSCSACSAGSNTASQTGAVACVDAASNGPQAQSAASAAEGSGGASVGAIAGASAGAAVVVLIAAAAALIVVRRKRAQAQQAVMAQKVKAADPGQGALERGPLPRAGSRLNGLGDHQFSNIDRNESGMDESQMTVQRLMGYGTPSSVLTNFLGHTISPLSGSLRDRYGPDGRKGPSNFGDKGMAATQTHVPVSGAIVAFPAFLEVDSTIAVRRLQLLGQGGFGKVYKAQVLDPVLLRSMAERGHDDVAALKVFSVESGAGSGDNVAEVFRNEVSIMYACQRSPYVARVFGVSHEPEMTLLMKMYTESVFQFLHKRSSTLYSDALEQAQGSHVYLATVLATQTALGVLAIHEIGAVHLDLKPANLLLERLANTDRSADAPLGIRCVICDFGLARLVNEKNIVNGRSRKFANGLSLNYCAPESFSNIVLLNAGSHISSAHLYAMDLFSLASTIYEIYTRQLPLGNVAPAEIQGHLAQNGRPVWPSGPDAEPWSPVEARILQNVREVCATAWRADPSQRGSAEAIAGSFQSDFVLVCNILN